MPPEAPYRTRFAPSPTGLLHLGHAYSALVAARRAKAHGGTFLLRIEDIDQPRCRSEYEAAIFEDLRWLGLDWPAPVMRQSDRMETYRAALVQLAEAGLIYPCACTRAEIRAALSAPQEGDGRSSGTYPGTCRNRPMRDAGPQDALRLNMDAALARVPDPGAFIETGPLHGGAHPASPEALLRDHGDVVLARRDIGTSYHIAVVVDDAAQGITEVVRGVDLFEATALHCLLQKLLGLPRPRYHHHRLIRDAAGRRLAKRDDARALQTLRAEGMTPKAIEALFTAQGCGL
ncbi:tRNA glutamyl-Q(34) synthetase GluQRS [Alkalilacustris brevis]|uniref:tRNA glutamyl-Q(34) synthetase GluQRS n=1 Tax=Alkalilacustris brevis TaxID=2026338 RepID=UPI000E0D5E30|nr:tRNA glutamyl-Q(34) synthetase GluQRS [Alkalilacustris brevis]